MKGYKEITDEILNRLQEGIVPWRQHWITGIPANAITKKPYRGINTWLLSMQSKFQSNLWLTYKQCKELGGYIRRGEHGRAIVFWKILEVEDEGEIDTIPMLRLYTVFNVQQTSIEMPTNIVEFNPISEAEGIVDGYKDKPTIEYGEPSYNPIKDIITMPSPTSFDTADHYYSTLYHELSHSTGHSTRLNRNLKNNYGNDKYAEEELIAEMSSAYLAGISGTTVYAKNIDNMTAYIKHWSDRFSDNEKLIVKLSSQAQKASDYVLGKVKPNADSINVDSDDHKPMQCSNCDKAQFVQSESSWFCLDRDQSTDNPTI